MGPMETLRKRHNFRDASDLADGYGTRLRPGRLYRMGKIHGLGDGELSVIRDLGITDIIDLRSARERLVQPDPEIAGIENHHIDMSAGRLGLEQVLAIYEQAAVAPGSVDAPGYITESYRELPAQCTGEVRKVVELIASKPEGSFLVHCAGGKDRTGFLTAVLLGSVGVTEEGILRDFLKSRKTPEEDAALLSRYLRRFRSEYGLDIPPEVAMPFLTVSEEAMAALLHTISSRFNGFDRYVTQMAGVTQEKLESLADWLTFQG